jgi:hypothetical protein
MKNRKSCVIRSIVIVLKILGTTTVSEFSKDRYYAFYLVTSLLRNFARSHPVTNLNE